VTGLTINNTRQNATSTIFTEGHFKEAYRTYVSFVYAPELDMRCSSEVNLLFVCRWSQASTVSMCAILQSAGEHLLSS
jgi:hypothetical protein